MNRIAYLTHRNSPHYCSDAFVKGLERHGFRVERSVPADIQPHDVLVTWNRHGHYDAQAKRFEKAGAIVLVTENGWIGKDADGHQLYAICRDHHNGAGSWSVGPTDRWKMLDIPLMPWRTDSVWRRVSKAGDKALREIVILPQRSIGAPSVAMPRGWQKDIAAKLRAVTERPVRIREHPGMARGTPVPDLADAWAVVVWASGAGIKAIVAGIPAFHLMPGWIGAPAAVEGIGQIEKPYRGERAQMLNRLAWAQWRVGEIETGEPFEWLL